MVILFIGNYFANISGYYFANIYLSTLELLAIETPSLRHFLNCFYFFFFMVATKTIKYFRK